MVLSKSAAVEQVENLISVRGSEMERLQLIRDYVRDKQDWRRLLPSAAPWEMRKLAEMARVNVLKFIVDSSTQSLIVDGFRSRQDDSPAWEIWQRNRMDARQIGIHRAALQYGASYATVLPGDTAPVIRGASPRNLTTLYGDDDEWPMWALEKRHTARGKLWRLFDSEATYWVGEEPNSDSLTFIDVEIHGLDHVPVVRYRETDDLDGDVTGIVQPLLRLQDQINMTTFGLLVAQHYGAFKQRWVIGWLAESEAKALKTSASTLMTWEDHPDDVKVGEFTQTDLDGYIDSREATLRHMATISQTPVHELLGALANLSAEALVAARDSHHRRLDEHRTVLGEAHEQTLTTAGRLDGIEEDPESWVRWRDVEGRALSQIADALGKFAEMLGIPKRALWERAAEALGASQQEVATWEAFAEEADPLLGLTAELERQMADG